LQENVYTSLVPCHVSSPAEEKKWWSETLSALCAILGSEIEEGNDMLLEDLLFDHAREVALMPSVGLQARAAVVRPFVANCPSVGGDAKDTLMYLDTLLTLADVGLEIDTDLFTAETLRTSDGRRQLFDHIISESKESAQTRGIISILDLWPAFDAEVYESMTGEGDTVCQLVTFAIL